MSKKSGKNKRWIKGSKWKIIGSIRQPELITTITNTTPDIAYLWQAASAPLLCRTAISGCRHRLS